jgi:hypothetical protein
MGGMIWKRPTAIKGTMNHAKTSVSIEMFAGAIMSVVQYLAPLRYTVHRAYMSVPALYGTALVIASKVWPRQLSKSIDNCKSKKVTLTSWSSSLREPPQAACGQASTIPGPHTAISPLAASRCKTTVPCHHKNLHHSLHTTERAPLQCTPMLCRYPCLYENDSKLDAQAVRSIKRSNVQGCRDTNFTPLFVSPRCAIGR